MKLSVIEVDGHAVCLRPLCRALEGSSVQATIYTRAAIWEEVGLQPDEYSGELRLLPDHDSLPEFFANLRDEINQSDLVLFSTLSSQFDFFADFDITPPTIIRVHNANTFGRPLASFRPFSDPGVGWRNLPKIVRNSARAAKHRPALRKILERAAFLMFPDPAITQHILRTEMFDERKVVRAPLPLWCVEPRERPRPDAQLVSIAVSGAISPRRRNYDVLVGAIRSALPRLECRVELALLGTPKFQYARDIVSRLRSLECDTFRLVSSEQFVPSRAFDAQMSKTDFLIAPISPAICHKRIFLEQYGYTKASGSIGDMVRFGLPAILPSSYLLAGGIRGLAAFYDDEAGLADLIVEWVNQRSFEKLDPAACLSDYSLQQVTQEVERTLEGLLADTRSAHSARLPGRS